MSTVPDIEERLRAALSARAELVRPEDLTQLAPVVPLRRRWTAPLIVLASAACVLLVLVLAFRLTDSKPRSDDLAPQPNDPQLVLPPDVGRDWQADDLSSPARLDLDGDGTKEKVLFLAEPSKDFDGRTRLQTTLSSTGEEAHGMAQLATTIGINALAPIDADGDGDQELVLYREDLDGGPGAPVVPLVFDLRDGLLVEAQPSEPSLLLSGYLPVDGSKTAYYDLVHTLSYWIEDGTLFSSRSVNSFARGNMMLLRPESYVVDTYQWRLGEDGILRPTEAGCRVFVPESSTECEPGAVDDPPYAYSRASATIGVGEQVEFDDGYGFTARIEPGSPPTVVVDGADSRQLRHELDLPDPEVNAMQPTGLFFDGASLVVTSASDPDAIQVLVQVPGTPDELTEIEPVGEIAFGTGTTAEGLEYRSWLTRNGALVTLIEADDGSWDAWQWALVERGQMAALPWGSICFDDIDDPTTGHSC